MTINMTVSSAINAECRYAECYYAECRYAECRYAECRYAECYYAECRGVLNWARCNQTCKKNDQFDILCFYADFRQFK
jgi:hypothetical protein